jgi:hypothetical protein
MGVYPIVSLSDARLRRQEARRRVIYFSLDASNGTSQSEIRESDVNEGGNEASARSADTTGSSEKPRHGVRMTAPGSRRFPPPWTAEETATSFIVCDANGQALAFVYCEDELARRSTGKLLTATRRRGSPSTSPSCRSY